MTYLVTWTIDIEADTPREAAEAARAIQLRPDSWATVFGVAERFHDGTTVQVETVDLDDDAAPAWIIGGPVEDGARLYWSNELGWAPLASATTFTDGEKAAHALPVGGEWWPA